MRRNFGDIIYDIVQKYKNVEVSQLRKLERLSMKTRKAELDIKFCVVVRYLRLYQNFKVLTYHIKLKLIQNLFVKDYCEVR